MPDLAGQIGLVGNPTHFWPHVISWATHSPVYHTVLAVDNLRCVSAEPGGARLRMNNEWPHIVWSDFDLTEAQRDTITEWGIAHLGTPYNFVDDIAIGLGTVFGWATPMWLQRYLSSDYTLECAQLVDSAYAAAGIHLFDDGRLPGAVFPASYVPIFTAHGWM